MSGQKSNLIVIIVSVVAAFSLVVVACIAITVMGLAYAQHQREVQRRDAVTNNLRAMGEGLVEHKETQDKATQSIEIVGRWSEESPDDAAPLKSIIFRFHGELYIERDSNDHGAQTIELVETAAPTGVRYDPVPPNDTGEYFVIDEAGDLQTWNEAGLISTASKLDGLAER